MADIKAFRALRYDLAKAGDISELTCAPYDIISEEQRLEYLRRNPYNIIRLELEPGNPDAEQLYEEISKFCRGYVSKCF